jgi:hypothetical protein
VKPAEVNTVLTSTPLPAEPTFVPRGLPRAKVEAGLIESGFATRDGHGLEPTDEGIAVSAALASWP